jgi:peptide/nickel transport system permease protein
MLAFIIRRLLQSMVVMFLVAMVAFLMFNYVGDPVHQMVGIETSFEEREKLRVALGLNDPAPIQFFRFIGNAAKFEFGISYQHKRSVTGLFKERLPATLELSFVAAFLSLVIGLPMGVYAGLKPNGWLSRIFMTFSLIGVSLPTFLIGIMLIFIFAVILGWLPSYGRGEVINLGWWSTGLPTFSGFKALIMPSVTLGLFQLTLIMRLVRSEMLEVLRTDYIKFARARGLSNQAVYFGHALKNTLVPVITITGLQLGSIIAFAIITETVFQWPGMGLMFLQAIHNVDIPIMAAYLMLVAFFFVVINLIVDILYYVVDPRLRVDAGKANSHE